MVVGYIDNIDNKRLFSFGLDDFIDNSKLLSSTSTITLGPELISGRFIITINPSVRLGKDLLKDLNWSKELINKLSQYK